MSFHEKELSKEQLAEERFKYNAVFSGIVKDDDLDNVIGGYMPDWVRHFKGFSEPFKMSNE
jgi:hypothetical protein